MRKIYDATYENGFWRIKTNEELDKLIKHENIINFARAQRLGWYGHIERMQDNTNGSKQYTRGNPFQRGQRRDETYAGRMTLEKIDRG